MAEVLVLNQNFEPLNICTMRRAVNMVLTGKWFSIRCNCAPFIGNLCLPQAVYPYSA